MRLSIGTARSDWWRFWLLSVPLPLLLGAQAVLRWMDTETMGVIFPAVLSAAVVGLVVLTAVYGAVLYQEAYWLRGTTLIQRGIGSDRRWDLSTASIALGHAGFSMWRPKGPALFVSAPGGRRLTLILGRRVSRYAVVLPADQFLALADAITSGRPDDPEAGAVAETLRRQARAPF